MTHGVRGVYTQGGYGRQERISTVTDAPDVCRLQAGQRLPGGGVYAIDRPRLLEMSKGGVSPETMAPRMMAEPCPANPKDTPLTPSNSTGFSA